MIGLADLFSCSGLGADGYAAVLGAGSITGFDIEDQPLYPYGFVQGDALALLADPRGPLSRFSVRHASPPCQEFTTAAHLRKAQGGTSRFGDLLTPTLSLSCAGTGIISRGSSRTSTITRARSGR
jgi:hypothetical protein